MDCARNECSQSVEISDKAYQRVHGRKMDYQTYHEHIEDICQSLDISRQENKITSNRVSEVHEQEEPRSINKHDISDDSDDQDDEVGETEDQDTDSDYEVNKTAQKKFIPYKPKSKAVIITYSIVVVRFLFYESEKTCSQCCFRQQFLRAPEDITILQRAVTSDDPW